MKVSSIVLNFLINVLPDNMMSMGSIQIRDWFNLYLSCMVYIHTVVCFADEELIKWGWPEDVWYDFTSLLFYHSCNVTVA